MRAAVAVALLLLAGCGDKTPAPAPKPTASAALSPPRTILISYGACHGTCPIFTITISSLGQGNFEGQNFTSLSGNRAFPVTRAQFDAVAAALAPIRPPDDKQLTAYSNVHAPKPQCDVYATDQPTRIVTWTGLDGKQQAMVWDSGCQAKRYAGVQPAIDKALAVLPVAPWIGQAKVPAP